MKRNLQLAMFVWILNVAIKFLPDDATATHQWLLKIPFEDQLQAEDKILQASKEPTLTGDLEDLTNE